MLEEVYILFMIHIYLGILKRELALEQQRGREKIISDHLGSPIEVRATTGGLRATMGGLPVRSCKYDSFGNIIEQNADFELPFRFAGGIWDEDTKLIRFGVRDYDPEVGRWTSVEPLGFAGSRNWYVYAGNDGVNYLDLDGLDEFNHGELISNNKIIHNLSKLDKFAIKMLQKYFCKGYHEDREFTGNITDSKLLQFYWGKIGHNKMKFYNYTQSEALIHGHGKTGDKTNTFSYEDVFAANSFRKTIYLVTQLGQIYKYVPRLLRLNAGGSIYSVYDPYLFGDIFRLPDLNCKCPENKK